jgi:hypothetical protein
VIKRSFPRGLALVVLVGLAWLISRRRGATAPASVLPPVPALVPWVPPEATGCPSSHPVKAKLASKIFHQPGMANYERTNPDRCYLNDTAAAADGFRVAKR